LCAGPRVSTTISGDEDIALGSIIVPLHAMMRIFLYAFDLIELNGATSSVIP